MLGRFKPQKGGVMELHLRMKKKNGQFGPINFQILHFRFQPEVSNEFEEQLRKVGGVTKIELTEKHLIIYKHQYVGWREVRDNIVKVIAGHFQTTVRIN